MKLPVLVVVVMGAALPGLLSAPVVHAQPHRGVDNPVDVGKIPESGPIVGGTSTTVGPNSKNQAVMPMPGSRQEELSERPRDTLIITPEVRPAPGPPLPARPTR